MSRDAVLGRIRASLGRDPADEVRRAKLRVRLETHPRGIVPARTDRDRKARIDLFVEMAEAVDTTVDRVASADEVPDAIGGFLARYNLGTDIRMAPDAWLEAIDWSRRPTLTLTKGASRGDDEVSVTAAFAGVAETGTLVLRSGPAGPTTLNFLPDNHIVVLRASQVVGPYEDVWDALRAADLRQAEAASAAQAGVLPRTVNMITGPSRSGDIEQTIMMGAHGPRRLHIVLVEDV